MICPNCGTETNEYERKCPNCGYEEAVENNQEQDYSAVEYQNINYGIQPNDDEDVDEETDNDNYEVNNEQPTIIENGEDTDDIIPEKIDLSDSSFDPMEINASEIDYQPVENNQYVEEKTEEESIDNINDDQVKDSLSLNIEEVGKTETTNKIEEVPENISTLSFDENKKEDLMDDINEKEDEELPHQLNDPKDSNKGMVVILIVVILLIVGALVYIGFFMKKDNDEKSENKTTTTTVPTTVANNQQQPIQNSRTIQIVDKNYKLPGTYSPVQQQNNTYFILKSDTNKIEFSLSENNDKKSYEILKTDLTKLQEEIKKLYDNEIVVTTPLTETINGIEITYTTISNGDQNAIYFICNTMYNAYITGLTINKNNTINKTMLEDFVSIFYNEDTENTTTNNTKTIYNQTMVKYDLKY